MRPEPALAPGNPGSHPTGLPVPLSNTLVDDSRRNWLPDMDLNHDKQIQSLLCYRYTIGQSEVGQNLEIYR